MNSRNFLFATILAGVSAFSGLAQAQEAGAGGSTGDGAAVSRGHGMKFLSEADRQHLMRVRREAMKSDPQLKTEEESLRQERKAAKDNGSAMSPADKQAFHEKRREYREQMDAAMLKVDPSIQPVLDQIKAHRHKGSRAAAPTGDGNGNP